MMASRLLAQIEGLLQLLLSISIIAFSSLWIYTAGTGLLFSLGNTNCLCFYLSNANNLHLIYQQIIQVNLVSQHIAKQLGYPTDIRRLANQFFEK